MYPLGGWRLRNELFPPPRHLQSPSMSLKNNLKCWWTEWSSCIWSCSTCSRLPKTASMWGRSALNDMATEHWSKRAEGDWHFTHLLKAWEHNHRAQVKQEEPCLSGVGKRGTSWQCADGHLVQLWQSTLVGHSYQVIEGNGEDVWHVCSWKTMLLCHLIVSALSGVNIDKPKPGQHLNNPPLHHSWCLPTTSVIMDWMYLVRTLPGIKEEMASDRSQHAGAGRLHYINTRRCISPDSYNRKVILGEVFLPSSLSG